MIYLRYVDRGRDCLSEDSIGESIQATKNKREEGSLVNGQDEAPRGQRYGTRCCSLIDGHDDANQYTVRLSSNDHPKIRELMYILAAGCLDYLF